MGEKPSSGPARIDIALFLVLSLTGLFYITSSPEAIAASCIAHGDYYFDGTNVGNVQRDGVTVRITPYTPNLCNGSWSFSAVWDMLQAQGTDPNQYAQVGYWRLYGQTTVYRFAAFSKNSSTQEVDKQGVSPGSNDLFKVQYNYSLGRMEMFINGGLFQPTNFDPAVSWNGNWTPEWEGETHDTGDDIPGVQTNPVSFSSMQVKNCRDCTYHAPSGNSLSADATWYCFAWITDQTEFKLWTHRSSC
jgi:hypothetical protein